MKSVAEAGLSVGTVLDGKYRIDGVIGRGGMGTVYRALHLALNEPVAMKILRPDAAADEEIVTRFLREAQWAAKLRSEHVARVHDVGQTADGLPFMVMEYLEGADLGQLVDQHGAMPAPVAIDLLLQACDAIAEAHALGIVHRDLKPTNLFVAFRPDQTAIVKVLDFGISKAAGGTDLSLTQTQSMLGTPAYMSPEQMRSARDVDQRTDLWSLGTVLYELVEGRRPFAAESFSEMCVMVAVDPPRPMTLAPELSPVLFRCLEKQPSERHANVAELMAELAPFASNPDAARYYVTRAQRILGVAGRDSQSAIPRGSAPAIQTGPIASATPPAMPIAALTMHARRPSSALTTTQATQATLQEPVAPARPSTIWIWAVLAVLLGVAGAIVYLGIDGEPERAAAAPAPAVTAPSAPASPPTTPPVQMPAEPPPAVVTTPPPVTPPTVSATEPAITRPPSKKPPIRKPPVKKPPAAKPPTTKPFETPRPPTKKCDPFDSRVKC